MRVGFWLTLRQSSCHQAMARAAVAVSGAVVPASKSALNSRPIVHPALRLWPIEGTLNDIQLPGPVAYSILAFIEFPDGSA